MEQTFKAWVILEIFSYSYGGRFTQMETTFDPMWMVSKCLIRDKYIKSPSTEVPNYYYRNVIEKCMQEFKVKMNI